MDDEIIIDIDAPKELPKKKVKKKKKASNKMPKVKLNNDKISNTKAKEPKKKKTKVKKEKMNRAEKPKKKLSPKEKKRLRKIKTILLVVAFIIVVILILFSSLFNIREINVEGNKKISTKKIVGISNLELNTNIFKFKQKQIEENIKENAYIENVTVKRKIPNTVNISVEERNVTYMLQFADSYVYINNQGYMLEISNEKLNVPILVGFTTDLSNIKAGNRLNKEDLDKMNMVIKIYETARNNGLNELITKIDISNPKNYTLVLESEGKTVYLGSGSDLNARMIHLIAILEDTKGKKGEIFLNVDLNKQRTYFAESVN